MSKRFAITGVAGYIAPRHLKAIKDTGNIVVAALDPHDAVGILDQYFPEADFFTEPERFDRHLEKLKRAQNQSAVEYVSICSPNYLHDAHIRMALRVGANAISEKPLVLNPRNLDLLQEIENETGKKIYNILQLRLHPAFQKLKKEAKTTIVTTIDLTYITSRGKWYDYSWKGNMERSGGIAFNIGIHFFDVLIWIYGSVVSSKITFQSLHTMKGELRLESAIIHWHLSIDQEQLPNIIRQKGQRTYRSILIDGNEIEFSEGFTDLHTEVYKEILNGNGFGIADARPSIELVNSMRTK